MKKTTAGFSEKTVETEKSQKTLAEKIGPVAKKEEEVLSGRTVYRNKKPGQLIRSQND
ncbi:MAG: hypothetical protein H7122_10780 [Chitinophagaceae bacterium]|nr:hypothetical protein [Chitinophagaceae bacterium]